jgi:predicted nucleotidyltransferase
MFNQLLERIALSLEERQIPYMVIGGQAVLLYGEPRLTRDIDITLGVGPERLNDVLALARASAWRVLVERPEDFVPRTLVLPLDDPQSGIRIDLIFSFSPYERQALERVRRVSIGRAAVRFAAVEDVIVHKITAGRPLDLEDVRKILLKNAEIDVAYVRNWLAEFGRSLEKDYVRTFDELLHSSH